MKPTGFSTAMRSQSASANLMKKTAAFALSSHLATTFSGGQHLNEYCRVATFDRKVQGGCAMIKSHLLSILCFKPSIVSNSHRPLISGNTSPLICHSGCPPEHSRMSQLYSSCQRSRNAMQTRCDSSQAIKTFILPPLLYFQVHQSPPVYLLSLP